MKKILAVLLTLIMAFGATSAFAEGITITVLGDEIDVDSAPYLDGETVMVPYRFVAEKLGAKVSWHGETQTVFSEYNGTIITAQIGNERVFVNNLVFDIDKAPQLANDRTMVSLDLLAQAMGIKCYWDAEAQAVTILRMEPGTAQ